MTQSQPDKITIESFMYGYFMILNRSLSPEEKQGRLEHGKQLMYHAVLHGWPSARRYHYKVLWAMEHDNLHWSNQEKLILLSMSAAQEPHSSDQKSISGKKEDKNKSIVCYFFNNDNHGCKYAKSPEGCKKLHACSSCADKGFLNNHPAFECRK